MSFAGSALSSGSVRASPLLSNPALTPDGGSLPTMRRGLTRFGAGLAESGHNLLLQHRLLGPWLPTRDGLAAGSSGHRPAGWLLPHATGRRYAQSSNWQHASEPADGVGQQDLPIDRAKLSELRAQREAKRLTRDYDTVPRHQLVRAYKDVAAQGRGSGRESLPGGVQGGSSAPKLPPPPALWQEQQQPQQPAHQRQHHNQHQLQPPGDDLHPQQEPADEVVVAFTDSGGGEVAHDHNGNGAPQYGDTTLPYEAEMLHPVDGVWLPAREGPALHEGYREQLSYDMASPGSNGSGNGFGAHTPYSQPSRHWTGNLLPEPATSASFLPGNGFLSVTNGHGNGNSNGHHPYSTAALTPADPEGMHREGLPETAGSQPSGIAPAALSPEGDPYLPPEVPEGLAWAGLPPSLPSQTPSSAFPPPGRAHGYSIAAIPASTIPPPPADAWPFGIDYAHQELIPRTVGQTIWPEASTSSTGSSDHTTSGGRGGAGDSGGGGGGTGAAVRNIEAFLLPGRSRKANAASDTYVKLVDIARKGRPPPAPAPPAPPLTSHRPAEATPTQGPFSGGVPAAGARPALQAVGAPAAYPGGVAAPPPPPLFNHNEDRPGVTSAPHQGQDLPPSAPGGGLQHPEYQQHLQQQPHQQQYHHHIQPLGDPALHQRATTGMVPVGTGEAGALEAAATAGSESVAVDPLAVTADDAVTIPASTEAGAVEAEAPAPRKKKRKTKKQRQEEDEASAAAAAEVEGSAEHIAAEATPKPLTRRVRKAAPEEAAADMDTATADGAAAAAEAAPKNARRKKPPSPASAASVAAEEEGVAAAPAPAVPAKVKVAVPPAYLEEGQPPAVPVEVLPGYFDTGVPGYVSQTPLMTETPPDVLVVDTPEVAEAVVKKLLSVANRPYPSSSRWLQPSVPLRYFACDTEVAFIDVTKETPIGHGAVLCFSIYGGDDLDFSDCLPETLCSGVSSSSAVGAARKDRIWVDVWHEVELGSDGRPIMDGPRVCLKRPSPILDTFKRFFEDESVMKVWHNYGFDRHVLENMGIMCRGFGGDTLHMARLADASRSGRKTYSLDSLTRDEQIMSKFTPFQSLAQPRRRVLTGNRRRGTSDGFGASPADGRPAPYGFGSSPADRQRADLAKLIRPKTNMKSRFGMFKERNGVPGKVPELPHMELLHRHPRFRPSWIDYSALDAKATWQLREALEGVLRSEPWAMEQELARKLGYTHGVREAGYLHLWHFYCAYWLDFGELLTEMERRGMKVNREHLAAAQVRAAADREAAVREFMDWAASKVPGARHMNPSSGTQIRLLLFPDFPGHTTKAAAVDAAKAKAAAAKAERAATRQAGLPRLPPGVTVPGLPPPPQQQPEQAAAAEGAAEFGSSKIIKVKNPDYEKELAEGKRPSRYMDMELHGIWGKGVPGALEPELLTATGAAAVSIRVLRGLAGKPGAARKELAKVLEEKARRHADDAAAWAAAEAAQAAARTAVPIVSDVLDEAIEALVAVEGDGNGGPDEEGDEGEEATAVAEEEGTEKEGSGARSVPVVADPDRLAALEKEAKDKGLGRLYAACGGGEEGLRACVAVEALCEVSAIDKLLSAFIIPLQGDDISTTEYLPGADGTLRAVHRVHCSLNINTETGRLSARRPNLQNQPALEKDRYKVRQAFTADTPAGHTLVVADYGQLELRILAHMTNCKSMQEAFIAGGDFHSRTAYGMYDYIKEDVANGGCYLEWDGEGEPDKPLVKDKYAAERRKAKVLNFSIAYGKTAHGLAADFKTTREEAQATVDKWYSDRPEVRSWQEDTRKGAREEGKVRTLLGRTRPLPNINSPDFKLSGHSNRAAINTPIQGSAADVAAAAMVAIHKSPELRATGFKLLMQIHDEVILEGPREKATEARRLVMKLMANPWAELARHWNDPRPDADLHPLVRTQDWFPDRDSNQPPGLRPEGHVAGVWEYDKEEAAARGHEGLEGKAGGAGSGGGGEGQGHGHGHGKGVLPLLVELATDCNVADTWYEAK